MRLVLGVGNAGHPASHPTPHPAPSAGTGTWELLSTCFPPPGKFQAFGAACPARGAVSTCAALRVAAFVPQRFLLLHRQTPSQNCAVLCAVIVLSLLAAPLRKYWQSVLLCSLIPTSHTNVQGGHVWAFLCLRWEHESRECLLYIRFNNVPYWISEVKAKFCVLSISSCKVQSSLHGVPHRGKILLCTVNCDARYVLLWKPVFSWFQWTLKIFNKCFPFHDLPDMYVQVPTSKGFSFSLNRKKVSG